MRSDLRFREAAADWRLRSFLISSFSARSIVFRDLGLLTRVSTSTRRGPDGDELSSPLSSSSSDEASWYRRCGTRLCERRAAMGPFSSSTIADGIWEKKA